MASQGGQIKSLHEVTSDPQGHLPSTIKASKAQQVSGRRQGRVRKKLASGAYPCRYYNGL